MRRILKKRATLDYRAGFKDRASVACFGLALVAVGVYRQMTGEVVVTHWTGQPMWSFGLIAAGIACIGISLLPNSVVRRIGNKSR